MQQYTSMFYVIAKCCFPKQSVYILYYVILIKNVFYISRNSCNLS